MIKFWHKKYTWITVNIFGGNLFNFEYFDSKWQKLTCMALFSLNFCSRTQFFNQMKYIWKYDFFNCQWSFFLRKPGINLGTLWSMRTLLTCNEQSSHTSQGSQDRSPASAQRPLTIWKSHIFICFSFLIEKLSSRIKIEWKKCHIRQCLPLVVKIFQIKEVSTQRVNSNPWIFFNAKSCL